MLQMKRNALIAVSLVALILSAAADARSIRVDSGEWNLSGFTSATSTQSIGFTMNFFGVEATEATIDADGSLVLIGGGEFALLLPLFVPVQGAGGNTAQYQVGVTDPALFNQPGIEAGFRVSYQTLDAAGTLLNEYQLSFFDLGGGLFATEFNYNQILFGDPLIGFETSLGDLFSLPASLGLSFADYSGIGDSVGTNNCANTPNAFACNNFFFDTMDYGPGTDILPDIANGWFRQIDTNGGTAQGRHLFLSRAVVEVPEPSSLALISIGLLAVGVNLRRKRSSSKARRG